MISKTIGRYARKHGFEASFYAAALIGGGVFLNNKLAEIIPPVVTACGTSLDNQTLLRFDNGEVRPTRSYENWRLGLTFNASGQQQPVCQARYSMDGRSLTATVPYVQNLGDVYSAQQAAALKIAADAERARLPVISLFTGESLSPRI